MAMQVKVDNRIHDKIIIGTGADGYFAFACHLGCQERLPGTQCAVEIMWMSQDMADDFMRSQAFAENGWEPGGVDELVFTDSVDTGAPPEGAGGFILGLNESVEEGIVLFLLNGRLVSAQNFPNGEAVEHTYNQVVCGERMAEMLLLWAEKNHPEDVHPVDPDTGALIKTKLH